MFKRKERGGGESEGKEAVQKLPLLYQIHYVITTSVGSLPTGEDVPPLVILTAPPPGYYMCIWCRDVPKGELAPRSGGSRATQHAQPRL